MPATPVTVTVIILNWNARTLLARCLPPLLAQDYDGDYHVVVADNASGDDSVAFVRRQFPGVEVLENQRNLGFSAGNNAALRRLQSDVAVLLNPDVVVAQDWLRQLVAGLTSEEGIGIAGSKLYYPGGTQLQHAGGRIEFPQAMPRYLGHNESDEGQHDARRDVDYVSGAAMAVRRSLLEEIGLLDDGFFLYFEDADLCFRARRAGYRVVYVPEAKAVHEESVLTGKKSPAYLAWFHSSRWRFLLKHALQQVLLRETMAAEEAWLAQRTEGAPLARAYGHTLRTVWQALQARVDHGGTPLDDDAASEITAALARLQQTAWRTSSGADLEPLRRRQSLQPFRFRSDVPLLGPLLSRLRSMWSRVASRPVVDAWAAQQRAFNQAVVEQLEARQPRLEKHDAHYAQIAAELSAHRRQLATLLERLETLDRRLAAVEAEDVEDVEDVEDAD